MNLKEYTKYLQVDFPYLVSILLLGFLFLFRPSIVRHLFAGLRLIFPVCLLTKTDHVDFDLSHRGSKSNVIFNL